MKTYEKRPVSKGAQIYYCYQSWDVGKEERQRCFQRPCRGQWYLGDPGSQAPAEVDHKVLKEVLQEATPVLLSYVTP